MTPLAVTCDSCGKTAETWDFQNPDKGLECGCCAILHDHAGIGCRPVTITGHAHLVLFDIDYLMDVAGIPASETTFEEVR